ncbi:lipoprotein-releasing system permease protein [Candidatus Xenohaliotis californiensis]|uniref:Lipoprotein-releasing system permease protein n=1 Tax=Candidatus Xenohaliotis californiensis TaxID=84677 RepID=A0ABP0EUY2_9RICK|nr:lipoprotein-releasing system permease protein [Candidatus Xenohaliotis californiensis]
MLLEISIAIRYIFTKKKDRFVSFINIFSLIGIALGVAAIIVVMAVMSGFQKELLDRVLGVNGHVSIEGIDDTISNHSNLLHDLNQMNDIVLVLPNITTQAMIVKDNNAFGVLVNGVDYNLLSKHPMIGKFITSANIEDNQTPIVLGARLAESLGVSVGDSVRLLSPNTLVSIFGSLPKIKDLQVHAIFDIGMYEYDSSFVYIPLNVAEKFFGLDDDKITGIDLFLTDDRKTSSISYYISQFMPDSLVYDWRKKNSSFFNALKIEKTVMFTILTLIILVATFNIVSGLMILVHDKMNSIAIMRTIGFSKRSIALIFILSGLFIGASGVLIGVISGYVLASNIDNIRIFLENKLNISLFNPMIYFLNHLPAIVKFNDVLTIVLLTMFFSLTATIIPALKAAKTAPSQLLRFY